MGIELPPELVDVAAAAGVRWPEADEDRMRESARAWRDAGTSLATLTGDADSAAHSALSTVEGDAATAAGRHWSTFVQPDTGHLTSPVNGCEAAADRLEHAAEQIGAAKVEIVRNLVALAKNADAANTAAAAGHPNAQLGLTTAINATAANVANINHALRTSVSTGAALPAADLVNANPGATHQTTVDGRGGLPNLLGNTTNLLTHTVDQTVGAVHQTVDHTAGAVSGSPLQVVTNTTGAVTHTITNTTGAVLDTASGVVDHTPLHAAKPLLDTVHHTVDATTGAVDQTVGAVRDTAAGAVNTTGNALGHTTGALDHTVGAVRDTTTGMVDTLDHATRTIRDTAAGALDHTTGAVDHTVGATGAHDHTAGVVQNVVAGPLDHATGAIERTTDAIPAVVDSASAPVVNHGTGAQLPPLTTDVPVNTVQAASAAVLDTPAHLAQPTASAPTNSPIANVLGTGAPSHAPTAQPGALGLPAQPAPAAPAAPTPAARPAALPAQPFAPRADAPPSTGQQPARPGAAAQTGGGTPGGKAESGGSPAPGKQTGVAPHSPANPTDRHEQQPEQSDHPDPAAPAFLAAPIPTTLLGGGSTGALGATGRPTGTAQPDAGPAQPRGSAPGQPNTTAKPGGDHANRQGLGHQAGPTTGTDQDSRHRTGQAGPVTGGDHPDSRARTGGLPNSDRQAPAHRTAQPNPGHGGAGHPSPGPTTGADQPSRQPGDPAPGRLSGVQHPAEPTPQQSPPAQPAPRAATGFEPFLLVHLFPIGHLPVATSRPARQVAAPVEEEDYAAGLRFEPGDHPDSVLVDSATPVAHPAPTDGTDPGALLTDYDPLAGAHERDWDRRFLVHPDGPEYAWPPGELYPEGGTAPGEPLLLAEDTLVDRFGTPDGRVFSVDGTPYRRRSLPPTHREAGYRRYRVRQPLPVWRAVSAPWFGQPGSGERYRTTHSAAELVALGFLEELS
ncbi:glycohydrolase toxin TNT-related protein [Actinokineospora auranticolor]|uniref:Uncharacterized protein DUF4237 n=1 Tax=Actinokineospora auranticolor TaxID=155976 RepID=A0A2S6GX62_9PSEU|nr:glycohydrolase toxin TNT-related protein [Actinokineospora auranticolor]PPK69776.1 uncharacterized protein DUF4237 [Actinokineospora auranticolor]